MLRKIKTVVKFTLLLACLLLLSGCEDDIDALNPLSDEEVISYVCSEIQKEFGDEVTATITSKTDLEVATDWFDGPINYARVKNGHKYELEIRRKDGIGTTASAWYVDGYVNHSENDNTCQPELRHNYESTGVFGVIQGEMEAELRLRFGNYRIYRSLPDNKTCRYNIFLQSTEAEKIAEVITRLREILSSRREKYATSFNIYIYKDEAGFREIDYSAIDLKPITDDAQATIADYTKATVTRSSMGRGFNIDFFNSDGRLSAVIPEEYIDPGQFDNIVFWYHWHLDSVKYDGILVVYGIRKK